MNVIEKQAVKFLIETAMDTFEELVHQKDKAQLLFGVKVLCITQNIDKPKRWYSQRNQLDWIDDNGNHTLGYDLGGF